jgi:predicted Zn-dependent peptidase
MLVIVGDVKTNDVKKLVTKLLVHGKASAPTPTYQILKM